METDMNQTKQTQTHLNIAFIEAKWHYDIVAQCRKGFLSEIRLQGYDDAGIDYFDVPGSLEIPLLAKKLAASNKYDAVVATGLIVDGGIYRHDFVARSVIDGMMRAALETGTPVLSAVLTPHHFQEHDAHKNFFADHFVIKGREAADACIEIIKVHRDLDQDRAVAA